RRLHDAGHSGGWFFLGLVPLGGIVPFIMTLLGPKESGTRFDAVQPGGGNWNQPGGYGPPAGYGQAPGYAPPGYGQTSGYGQDPGYTPPGYGPGPSAPAAQPPLGPDGLPRYPQN
ncbi:MAG: DUF805 domain-containing protein, partial [Bifidobacteriaceae bacterium]|nr:DUF805 domain-containing protein [Bifidobacteriaceae bacterium]